METTTAAATVIMLRAAEGKALTDGHIYVSEVAVPSQEAASRWREVDAPEEPARELPTTCTKYELVNALQELDPELLTSLRAAYAQYEDLQFYWNTVQELDRDNDDFQRFAAMLGADDAQLDALFAAIAEARS